MPVVETEPTALPQGPENTMPRTIEVPAFRLMPFAFGISAAESTIFGAAFVPCASVLAVAPVCV